MNYQDLNAATIDRWVDEGWEWGVPLSHEAYAKALAGEWEMRLTPGKPVPRAWFPPLAGCRVLGLAAGGGQQMPLFAALGAKCTVLDYSSRQIESERRVAAREGYEITCVRADMTKPLPFADGSFDLVFHPVSNCYIREVEPVWRECGRVLRPGGLLMAGLDNGFNYLFGEDEEHVTGTLPFDPLVNEEQRLIEAINRSMQETEVRLRAMGRKPYYITREEAEKQVAMLLKAKEEFFAKQL